MIKPVEDKEANDAATEFIQVVNPLFQKAAKLGIIDADTTEFTDGFQAVVSSYPNNLQHHAAAILVINEWLRRTNQSITDNEKGELAFLVLCALLDGRMNFLEQQYNSLIEELERKGVIASTEEEEKEK